MRKVFVSVNADFEPEGNILPRAFVWEDGRRFSIDRITDVRPAASMKAGGFGMRYTCEVLGRRTFLFLDGNRWFMEGK